MSASLIDVETDLLFRFVELIGLLLGFEFADDLFEELDQLKASAAFVTFDVKLDLAVRLNCDV